MPKLFAREVQNGCRPQKLLVAVEANAEARPKVWTVQRSENKPERDNRRREDELDRVGLAVCELGR
jgi:hypothetical protein